MFLVHDKNKNVRLSAVEMLMKTIFSMSSTALRLTIQHNTNFCHVLSYFNQSYNLLAIEVNIAKSSLASFLKSFILESLVIFNSSIISNQ